MAVVALSACSPNRSTESMQESTPVTAQVEKIAARVAVITPAPSPTPAESTADFDKDGIPDKKDNCPATANSKQKNKDGDLRGDACENDVDGDEIPVFLPSYSHVLGVYLTAQEDGRYFNREEMGISEENDQKRDQFDCDDEDPKIGKGVEQSYFVDKDGDGYASEAMERLCPEVKVPQGYYTEKEFSSLEKPRTHNDVYGITPMDTNDNNSGEPKRSIDQLNQVLRDQGYVVDGKGEGESTVTVQLIRNSEKEKIKLEVRVRTHFSTPIKSFKGHSIHAIALYGEGNARSDGSFIMSTWRLEVNVPENTDCMPGEKVPAEARDEGVYKYTYKHSDYSVCGPYFSFLYDDGSVVGEKITRKPIQGAWTDQTNHLIRIQGAENTVKHDTCWGITTWESLYYNDFCR